MWRLGVLLAAAVSMAGATRAIAAEKTRAAAPESRARASRTAPQPSTDSISIHGGEVLGGDITAPRDFPSVDKPTAEEKLLLDLVNVERTTRGLKPLAWDGMLSHLARLHTDDMRNVHHASHHSTKDGADYAKRLARTPYRARVAAENVAYNADVVKAHRALMNSPGHRRNILDPELTTLGTAVMTEPGSDWIYVCEDFATPISWVSDSEARSRMAASLTKARSGVGPLQEDRALSDRLGEELERMISAGSVREGVGSGFGPGWSMAFTSMDPSVPPASALARAKDADGYAVAVSFRKTPKYPFGTYWAILFLKGTF